MTRTLAAACSVIAIALVFLWFFERPEAGLDLSPTGEGVEQQVDDVRRTRSKRPVATNPTPDRAESPPAEHAGLPEGKRVLRVVLEGITDEDAQRARISLTGVDEGDAWPEELRDSWPSQGLQSEFDLDPFFASVAERLGKNLRLDELVARFDHPMHFRVQARVLLSRGVKSATGQTVHEVRMRIVPPVFFPELTLSVRDARTRRHLEGVELRCVSTSLMGIPRQPGPMDYFSSLARGLGSPIVLTGVCRRDDPKQLVAGLVVRSAAGGAPQLVELGQDGRIRPTRGIVVYLRAPGYSWRSTGLHLSSGTEVEVLLDAGASLDVRLTNVQLERYTDHEVPAFFSAWYRANSDERWNWSDDGSPIVRIQRLDETMATDGLRLEGLDPGQYLVKVQIGHPMDWSSQRPVLAREELTLIAGESRELMLALDDPPALPKGVTLGGLVSFPTFAGEKRVKLQLYHETSSHRRPRVELSLADMEPASGALPTWSFRQQNLPIGRYRAQLLPFMKSWMIELPDGGREDVELVIPQIAELHVETVDARNGERIPLDELFFRHAEILPGRKRSDWAEADLEEPGRFRVWTTPGAMQIYPNRFPSGLNYAARSMDLDLVPGLQSVLFEFEPFQAIRLLLRLDAAVLPRVDEIWSKLRDPRHFRALDHDGQVKSFRKLREERIVEVSAPGTYEISFEGIGADRFQPIPPQRVTVGAGETAEVIVDLRRK